MSLRDQLLRLITARQQAALRGSYGVPSGSNPFVTDLDPRLNHDPTNHASTHEAGGDDPISFFSFHADPSPAFSSPPVDGWWLEVDQASPQSIQLKSRVNGDTETLETWPDSGGSGVNGTVLHFSFGDSGGFDPADATTYYFGQNLTFDPQVVSAFFTFTMPKAGTAKIAYGKFQVAGTLGSSGNSTLTLRNITASTSQVISSTVALTATPTRFNKTNMTLAFSAGDELEISWLTPTWVTNPGTIYGHVDVYVEFS